jgi:DNA-binding NtrC family response regulator
LMTDDLQLGARHFSGVLTVAEGLAMAPPDARAAAAKATPEPAAAGAAAYALGKPLSQAVAELEASAIRAALQATGNNKQATARMLGIARATLYEKLAVLAERPA